MTMRCLHCYTEASLYTLLRPRSFRRQTYLLLSKHALSEIQWSVLALDVHIK